jgi:hypothetical protein
MLLVLICFTLYIAAPVPQVEAPQVCHDMCSSVPMHATLTRRPHLCACYDCQVCRQRRIPVIFDEVFTGCWRLGVPTAGQLLGPAACKPDIACYAKLLTSGAAPLAVTLTTEEVFEAFKGPSKVRQSVTAATEQQGTHNAGVNMICWEGFVAGREGN